ncbi:hypothetical protein AXF42_Ash009220 [Apostasia shenzhenica]|uniref:Uncharacterized protein n=1 Tax=Apostasia shenzhenica TaxID=1088818 RepID=A0A2I0B3G9_9ASPA|nr:hypothetical protein AXF42_Ash009220 [Apostasia shenzhenica]
MKKMASLKGSMLKIDRITVLIVINSGTPFKFSISKTPTLGKILLIKLKQSKLPNPLGLLQSLIPMGLPLPFNLKMTTSSLVYLKPKATIPTLHQTWAMLRPTQTPLTKAHRPLPNPHLVIPLHRLTLTP